MAEPVPGEAARRGPRPTPFNELPAKGRVFCQGRIESITYVPADRSAAFSAIVSDSDPARRGSGTSTRTRIRVVWLGRRRVPGIEAGTELRLEGMLSRSAGMPTMFNPRYEILSRQENE
ncbi:hypothetical protein FDW83_02715 [Pseudarthrobacter sp. NamE2]|uniref:OB-fold nucleic acid binding domain-containing protein n=1 Tax=Pseudarthrobacter sp. NamE2 TaxID=2576838 RepID=UPI0010FDAED7|nr:OB-fold nucleic acid binding domain-containing protein [Pseudarthrobacter sp. NamE2]TLM86662.1 hypothetical protein FDW83_02715 [Pseudarthrobacter sp. NamE2]